MNTWYFFQVTHFGKMFLAFLDSLNIFVIWFQWVVLKVCFSCGMTLFWKPFFIMNGSLMPNDVSIKWFSIIPWLFMYFGSFFRRYITLSWFSAIIVLNISSYGSFSRIDILFRLILWDTMILFASWIISLPWNIRHTDSLWFLNICLLWIISMSWYLIVMILSSCLLFVFLGSFISYNIDRFWFSLRRCY